MERTEPARQAGVSQFAWERFYLKRRDGLKISPPHLAHSLQDHGAVFVHADGFAPQGRRKDGRQTRGLVLVPTRELAMQVAEAIHKYAKGVGISVVPIYGGAPISVQIRTLERGAGIVERDSSQRGKDLLHRRGRGRR